MHMLSACSRNNYKKFTCRWQTARRNWATRNGVAETRPSRSNPTK